MADAAERQDASMSSTPPRAPSSAQVAHAGHRRPGPRARRRAARLRGLAQHAGERARRRPCAAPPRLLRERADSIAQLLTQEQGKPLAEARGEVLAGADIIEWFADEGLRVYGRIVPLAQPRRAAAGAQGAGRPGRRVHAVELPDQPDRAQARRGAGHRLLVPCQGARRNPGRRPPRCCRPSSMPACPPGTVGLVFGDPAEIS